MKNNISIILLVLLPLTFSSCSGIKPTKRNQRAYSQEVESEFGSIENDNKKILNYYRSLREKNWEEYKSHGKKSSVRRRYQRPAPRQRKSQARFKKITPAPKPALSQTQVEELNIEINQNLSYFCMKKRKSTRFKSPADCETFTEQIRKSCKEKYPVYRDRSPVECVKSKLH